MLAALKKFNSNTKEFGLNKRAKATFKREKMVKTITIKLDNVIF